MKVEKIIGEDYCLYPTGWTISGANHDNVFFNTHSGYYFQEVPDLLACERPLSVIFTNGKELNFPVVEWFLRACQ